MKDYAYASLFAKEDLPHLYGYAELIRHTHNQNLVDDFNNICEKKWNDHNSILETRNKNIEFLKVAKADDLIVTVGINQCLDQIIGVSTTRWRYMQYGDGTYINANPTIGETTLLNTVGSVDMSLFGWREYASTALKFGAIGGESINTITISETGISTLASLGIILNHNYFGNNTIAHSVNVTGFVLTGIVEFVPMM